MAKSDILKQIYWYDISGEKGKADHADMIKFAKRAAKLVNNRLYKLEKAGLASGATTGGIKHINLADIKDSRSAARALSKAKSVLANPISTVGSVKKQIRSAEQEYGKSGRMKFITEEVPVFDDNGNPTGRYRLVPKAVPVGTNKGSMSWTEARKMLKNFWGWYNKIGNSYLSSEDAYDIWVESGYNSKNAIPIAERHIQAESEMAWQEYKDQQQSIYGFGSWLE